MATMTEKTVIDQVRDELGDNQAPYDWAPDTLRRLLNQEVRAIASQRPHALISSSGTLITITDSTGESTVLSIDDQWKSALVEGIKTRALLIKSNGKENAARAELHMANREREIQR